MYRIGVEDDGCHSLSMYEDVAETARVLELLARSLNAVVVERIMIQDEIELIEDAPQKCKDESKAIRVAEPSLLGDGRDQMYGDDHDDQKEEKSTDERIQQEAKQQRLDKQGAYTRCELTIQRVETHLLDPSPISVKQLAAGKKMDHDNNTELASRPQETGERLSVGETMSARNIRVAVVGNVDAGKSTIIGTLTSSCLDDGRGSSRTSIMKHRHEIESGRTSTATTHLMGFKSSGEAVVAAKDRVRGNRRKPEDEVARESHRVVTLMDLAGHEKYLKTT
jgi:GTPase